ncbi:MAG: hypothetical protein JRG86_18310 [Deltaproteobacteria bacterium]|nr:hypothetical protein [Deltaproteobacteria bacterium]MBW2496234.1 hypothetical protein [Deltaproteobacteria bacterium]
MRTDSHSRLWVNPDHQMGRYDKILIQGIGIQYDKSGDALDAEEQQRVKRALLSAVRDVTKGAPVGFTSAPGPCVVSMSVGLMNLRMDASRHSGSVSSYVSSFGAGTMIFEFRDSETNVPLIRFATRRDLGGGRGHGTGADIHRLGQAVGRMAQDMTRELQTIVPAATRRDEHGCNNGILRMSGRDARR